MKRFLVSALTVAAIAASIGRAEAAPLIIVDDGKDGTAGNGATWTLTATEGCQTNCTITLGVVFANPTEYAGTFLDAVQWSIAGGDIANTADPVQLTAAPGGPAQWTVEVDSNLNGGGGADSCGGGAQNAVCSDYINLVGNFGFGPITDGMSLSWTFVADFASALPTTFTTGNIRAAFNTSTGANYNVFSPGSVPFQGQGTPLQGQGQPQQGSPEPASVLLFGAALTAVGMRLRRARA